MRLIINRIAAFIKITKINIGNISNNWDANKSVRTVDKLKAIKLIVNNEMLSSNIFIFTN